MISKDYIRIDVPDDEPENLLDHFRAAFDSGQLTPAMDLGVKECDERAVVYETTIDEVEQQGDGTVTVYYSVHWDAYYGCSDMNCADIEERYAVGELDGDAWVFEVYVPPEPRSTFEEF